MRHSSHLLTTGTRCTINTVQREALCAQALMFSNIKIRRSKSGLQCEGKLLFSISLQLLQFAAATKQKPDFSLVCESPVWDVWTKLKKTCCTLCYDFGHLQTTYCIFTFYWLLADQIRLNSIKSFCIWLIVSSEVIITQDECIIASERHLNWYLSM